MTKFGQTIRDKAIEKIQEPSNQPVSKGAESAPASQPPSGTSTDNGVMCAA